MQPSRRDDFYGRLLMYKKGPALLKAGPFFKWTEEAAFCIRSDFYGRDLIYEKGPALFKAGPFFKWTGEAAFCTKRVRLRPGGRKEIMFF